ncbi:long-chain fatty acid--CoA ligase [Rhodoblastus sphagnicola]|uniref:Long-chain fatty acid--CoA ligase n=2 Tax=Rhodoblastus sphagnicola TaxID=333368 RepID=A0A2S6N9L6_9HYPH|nr:AMP-binding protein [Rhodoblastus sphagnicola]PPQ31291.1 long-chain fatty acid--CoA ligase [Rhodoblastus sphagnicola]
MTQRGRLLFEYLRDSAAQFPGKPAVIVGDQAHSFREIDEDSDRVAEALQRLGVRRGDRVGAILENSIELVVAMWATLKAGAVFIPISPQVKAEKLGFMLADSGATALFATASLVRRVEEAVASISFPGVIVWVGDKVATTGVQWIEVLTGLPHPLADPQLIDQDLCLIIYTSGSTGSPKGVMMTHRNICNNVWSISTYLRNQPEDVVLCVLPLSFDYGLFQILTGARVGFTVVLERSFAFPYDVLKRIGAYRVTGLPGVPTIFAKILEFAPFDRLDLTSLRYLSNTAAAFPAAHIRALRTLLPQATIFSMYGLTECTRVSYLDPSRLDAKITSVGRAMPNSETYIVDEHARRCGPREIGELVVRGASVMRGYWRRPEETARTLRDGDIAGEKVLFTGDLFWMDEEGDLYFVGRRDDVFKCRGEKVSPREVEACLYELDWVAEVSVVGVPHPSDGMAIKAHVVARAGRAASEDQLRKHCMRRLEPLLVPRFFEVAEALPKTDSGKIKTAELRRKG